MIDRPQPHPGAEVGAVLFWGYACPHCPPTGLLRRIPDPPYVDADGRLSCRDHATGTWRTPRTCQHCGAEFPAARTTARYCGTRCRTAAMRARRRAAAE